MRQIILGNTSVTYARRKKCQNGIASGREELIRVKATQPNQTEDVNRGSAEDEENAACSYELFSDERDGCASELSMAWTPAFGCIYCLYTTSILQAVIPTAQISTSPDLPCTKLDAVFGWCVRAGCVWIGLPVVHYPPVVSGASSARRHGDATIPQRKR